jgi:ribA/ribD-fused uncharacterized protein
MDDLPLELEALRAAVKQGARFAFLPFWGHTAAGGALRAACLSQWYPAPFKVGGERYATAEHWMMACKARLFGDAAALEALRLAPLPSEAKALGRSVRGFDAARWSSVAFDFVVQGSAAKFSSTPELRAFLLATAPAILVEASPRDTLWGIGLGPKNPAAHKPLRWRGRNLLGFALTRARQLLAAEEGGGEAGLSTTGPVRG